MLLFFVSRNVFCSAPLWVELSAADVFSRSCASVAIEKLGSPHRRSW